MQYLRYIPTHFFFQLMALFADTFMSVPYSTVNPFTLAQNVGREHGGMWHCTYLEWSEEVMLLYGEFVVMTTILQQTVFQQRLHACVCESLCWQMQDGDARCSQQVIKINLSYAIRNTVEYIPLHCSKLTMHISITEANVIHILMHCQ